MFEGDDIGTYSLFGFLEKSEQEYLKKIKNAVRPKEKEVKIFVMPPPAGGQARKVIAVGVSKKSEFSTQKAALAARIAIQAAKKEKIKKFAFWVAPWTDAKKTQDFYEAVAANAQMADFEFVKYKTPPKDGFNFVEEIQALCKKFDKNIAEGFRRGTIIGEEVNAARRLANTPGGDMTPRKLAEHAKNDMKGTGVKVQIFEEKKIKALKNLTRNDILVGSTTLRVFRNILFTTAKKYALRLTVVLTSRIVITHKTSEQKSCLQL